MPLTGWVTSGKLVDSSGLQLHLQSEDSRRTYPLSELTHRKCSALDLVYRKCSVNFTLVIGHDFPESSVLPLWTEDT